MYAKSAQPFRMVFLLAAMLACPVLHAAELDIPHLKTTVTLSKNKISAGEPINLRFAFRNVSDGTAIILVDNPVGPYSERIGLVLSIHNMNGQKMSSRTSHCQPASQRTIAQAHLQPGETLIADYPLHLQVSTNLEPGQYTVSAKGFDVSHGFMSREYLESVGSGVKKTDMNRETFSVQGLHLEVEPSDGERLEAVYEDLMKEARYALTHLSGSWTGHDFLDIAAPIRAILWALGPEAMPYQLELLYNTESGFRFWPPATMHTWENIASHATLKQTKYLVGLASQLDFEKPAIGYGPKYAPGYIWTMHKLQDDGTPEMRELTSELGERLPKEELCPRSMEIGVPPYGKG